jgi:thiamine-phosphate pyrophosphorylase
MNGRGNLDLGVYLVTDRPAFLGRDPLEVVAAAVAGGASVVQLREKRATTREFVELARALLGLLRPLGVPLIINDRVDVALAAGADGVHVGQDDMDPRDVRKLIGPDKILGLSVTGADEARTARGMPVDYLGAGPVFATATKKDAGAPQGLSGLATMLALAEVPVVAIGAITTDNAAAVMDAGASGLAVVSAICSAPDPRAAAQVLRRIVDAKR